MLESIYKNADTRMQKSMESLAQNLAKLRTGRAHPSLLDSIHVSYYGTPTPLSQVANVTAEDAQTLCVTPWERTMVQDVDKAIRSSGLGLNPAVAGMVIRVPLPPLTEERRKDLVRQVKTEAEDARVALRNIRRDANSEMKQLLKAKDITEDEERKGCDRIQKLIDRFVEDVEKLVASKETELMKI